MKGFRFFALLSKPAIAEQYLCCMFGASSINENPLRTLY